MLPETCKESGEAYLQWDLYHHKTSGKECTPPHLCVHQVRKDYQVKGSNPEVVHKKEGLRRYRGRKGETIVEDQEVDKTRVYTPYQVKPLHIIGCKVDHVTN